MNVFEINNQRFDIASELFAEGRNFNFNDVSFYQDKETEILEVCIASQWLNENLTEQRALEQINRAKKTYEYLITNSDVFADMVRNYKLRFSIAKDMGNAWIELAYLSNGKLFWI